GSARSARAALRAGRRARGSARDRCRSSPTRPADPGDRDAAARPDHRRPRARSARSSRSAVARWLPARCRRAPLRLAAPVGPARPGRARGSRWRPGSACGGRWYVEPSQAPGPPGVRSPPPPQVLEFTIYCRVRRSRRRVVTGAGCGPAAPFFRAPAPTAGTQIMNLQRTLAIFPLALALVALPACDKKEDKKDDKKAVDKKADAPKEEPKAEKPKVEEPEAEEPDAEEPAAEEPE